MLDEHYRVIYASDGHSGAREPIVNPDVNIWYPETSSSIQTVGDDNIGNDEEVEEATEEKLLLTNPSNGKNNKRAKPHSNNRSKKAKLHPSVDEESVFKSIYQKKAEELESELDKCKKDAEMYKQCLQETKDELDKCKKDADTFSEKSKDELDKCKKDADMHNFQKQESKDELEKCKKDADMFLKKSNDELDECRKDALNAYNERQRKLADELGKCRKDASNAYYALSKKADDELDKCKRDADTISKKLKDELDESKKDVDTFLKSLQKSKDELEKCKKDADTFSKKKQQEGDQYKADRDTAIEEARALRLSLDESNGKVETLEYQLGKISAECTPLDIKDDGSPTANLVKARLEIQMLNSAAVKERRMADSDRADGIKFNEKCMILEEKVCLFAFQLFKSLFTRRCPSYSSYSSYSYSYSYCNTDDLPQQLARLQKDHDHYKKLSEQRTQQRT